MKIAVIQFPGSNCEKETNQALKRAGLEPVNFLWNEPVKKLEKCHGFVIVGGFSYEDRSRAGVIAAMDPVMKVLAKQAEKGKPILGICNGAQILLECGLVPGVKDDKVVMALTENKRVQDDKVVGTGFYNNWIHMRQHSLAHASAFNIGLTQDEVLRVPIAHAQGRFVMSSVLLKEINEKGLVAFQYCDGAGDVVDEFPVNPNGSVANIAAVTNYAGNVMAMMPHPERTGAGDAIFSSMRDYIEEKEELRKGELSYQHNDALLKNYDNADHQLLVELVLTDNAALSVQMALQAQAINVNVKRYTHWQVQCGDDVLDKIKRSEELYNPKKEFLIEPDFSNNKSTRYILVQQNEDFVGQQKFQLLANHFEIYGIKSIRKGVVWAIEVIEGDAQKTFDKVLQTGLLYNPISQQAHLLGA
jgi:phosphoribosylformylglycinamidine synthase subunit PurQ / glutaminase